MKTLFKALKNFLPPRSLAHETILLVEDDTLIRQFIIKYLLEKYPGLTIDTASDGVEALDKITMQSPTILITNVNMPSIDGITLLKILQELRIFLPTLVISGGWTCLAFAKELAALARKLMEETMEKQSIRPGQLLIHADRGSSMTSKPVACHLADLGVTKSHSRPSVSNDNPYSESQFKTMKYRPEFPERFGSIEHAGAFSQTFFPWYNTEHCHSGLRLLKPEDVHYGKVPRILEA